MTREDYASWSVLVEAGAGFGSVFVEPLLLLSGGDAAEVALGVVLSETVAWLLPLRLSVM